MKWKRRRWSPRESVRLSNSFPPSGCTSCPTAAACICRGKWRSTNSKRWYKAPAWFAANSEVDVPPRNPLREALEARRFCYVVELVASRISREARLLETATQLAQIPGVVAGSVTSYAGGSPGHNPIRVGTAARARGLTPNIHVTCVSRDRQELRDLLETLNDL